ncbi:hypothetical protein X777_03433 [Ooceraea biroi]|uniref:Secreted protein n=1 Tax=Ooceraea biroi TaxID=2015173 RepID=A0A026X2S6_OOCBI|nr:hypothetical protein X777_03433 [Ooceraea biroi]
MFRRCVLSSLCVLFAYRSFTRYPKRETYIINRCSNDSDVPMYASARVRLYLVQNTHAH